MAIQFYLTNVGRTAALNAATLGLDLQIKNIAVGDASSGGLYDAAIEAATMTALDNELERYLVNGGEIEPTTHTLRFTVNLNSTITADIYEIGLFDENNVLFAVASSTTTPLVQLINEVITIITFGFSLDDVDNITLMLDVNSPLAVTLMNQHTAHEHPHAQYKRINDDTERLKVANGTDPKDAVNKEQLDAESTARSNADTNLQNTKAAKNGDNTQRFKVSNAVDADDAVAKNQLDTVVNVLPTKANKNGDAAETFNVANGTSGSHAVNKSQLDTKAPVAGNAAQEFAVATATTGNSAVNKTQYETQATETVKGIVEICTDAELLAGSSDVVVATPLKLRLGFAATFAANGYIAFPTWLGGLILQWGEGSTDPSDNTEPTQGISFSVAFTTVYQVYVSTSVASANDDCDMWYQTYNISTTGFNLKRQVSAAAANSVVTQPRWFAIGK